MDSLQKDSLQKDSLQKLDWIPLAPDVPVPAESEAPVIEKSGAGDVGEKTDYPPIAEPDAQTQIEDAAPSFPKPGSPTREVRAWWGRRLVDRSRRFVAQREERAHRDLLARLKQSLQALSQNEAKDEDGNCNAHGPALAACLYIVIHCPQCSDVRQAREDYPDAPAVTCPQCGLDCGFTALGAGLTRNRLPFHEIQVAEPFDIEGKPRIPWDPLSTMRKVKLNEEEE